MKRYLSVYILFAIGNMRAMMPPVEYPRYVSSESNIYYLEKQFKTFCAYGKGFFMIAFDGKSSQKKLKTLNKVEILYAGVWDQREAKIAQDYRRSLQIELLKTYEESDPVLSLRR